MEGPNEKQSDDITEGVVESSHPALDQGLIPQPNSSVRRKPFKGNGDSLNSMAERDRLRHEMAKSASALRISIPREF